MPDAIPPLAYSRTPRTRLKRRPERARYDVEAVHAALDAGLICHVGYLIGNAPFVTPTSYWRDGDRVYWHGAAAGTMLKQQSRKEPQGVPVCFTVTHCDGIVLARSAFHHSMNYRSVMAFGTAEPITDSVEKRRQLELFVERIAPGRSDEVRAPTSRELRVTSVMSLKLDEVVLKVRSGPPKDDAEDMALPVWAGVLPVSTRIGPLQPDPLLDPATPTPKGLRRVPIN